MGKKAMQGISQLDVERKEAGVIFSTVILIAKHESKDSFPGRAVETLRASLNHRMTC
jgi:hypothetical protein